MQVRALWLFAALFLAAILAALHYIALSDYLYWRHVWIDVPMHLLGGLAIGVFLVGFLIRFRPRFYVFLFSVGMIAWEVFEYLFGLPRESNYLFDTSLDLLMDAFGGLAVYTLARMTLWKKP